MFPLNSIRYWRHVMGFSLIQRYDCVLRSVDALTLIITPVTKTSFTLFNLRDWDPGLNSCPVCENDPPSINISAVFISVLYCGWRAGLWKAAKLMSTCEPRHIRMAA